MEQTDLELEPNEASDLTPVLDADVLAAHGWDSAFATVLDEAPAEDAIALLVHAAGEPLESGWRAYRVNVVADGAKGRTEDAEAITRHRGWLYLLGSQYGATRRSRLSSWSLVALYPRVGVV